MRKDKITAYITGIVLFLIAGLFSIAIISGALDFGNSEGFFHVFGSFIVSVYGICSILIPAFFFTAGLFCFMENWSVQKAIILLISVVPFFTLVFAEKTVRSIASADSSPAAYIKIFTTIIVALLLAAAEYLLALVLSNKFHDKLAKLDFPFTGKKEKPETKEEVSENTEADGEPLEEDASESAEETEEDPSDLSSILAKNRKEIEKITSETEPVRSNKYDHIWTLNTDGDVSDSKDKDAEENSLEPESDKEILEKRKIVLSDDEDRTPFETVKDATEEPSSNFSMKTPENIEVVNLQDIIPQKEEQNSDDNDAEEDDIIAQFEKENQNLEQPEEFDEFAFAEEPPEEEEYSSEIPFDDYNEEQSEPRQDTSVEALMENFNAIVDEENSETEAADNDEPMDFSNNSFEMETTDSDTSDNIEEESAEETEPEIPTEEFSTESEEDSDNSENRGLPFQGEPDLIEEKKTGSMLSSLDSVFSRMEEDAKEQVEKGGRIDPTAPAIVDSNGKLKSESAVSGPVAVVTDENGNSTPIKVVPKKRHKQYKISTDLLTEYEENRYWEIDDDTRAAASNLMDTLKEFNIDANITDIRKGPVVTMFEMLPAPGVKLSKIQSLQDNIALRLAAKSVRIVAPIPGKSAVGIEIPNSKRAIVSFRECIEQNRKEWNKMEIPVILGKDIEGETQLFDLTKTPHLLIAGSTGAGKSVCVNSMILSILYKRSPNQVKMILIDPKIVELSLYNGIGHLLTPVITEPKMAIQALQYCICEMERRYAVLKSLNVRDILSYNTKIEEQHLATEKLPYIVVVIDEFADLMATTGKQMEASVARLAAKSRAVGIHLVLATQRPSTDVITGVIKANLPSRIAFMVSSKIDSRIIIDQMGADKLLGKGDMLYASATDPFPVRIQGTLVTDQEVENVVNAVKDCWGEPEYIDDEIFVEDEEDGSDGQMSLFAEGGEDPLYEKALDIVIQAGKASASYIQRRLSIGYNRAARLVEEMEERGIVGPANGSKPREIIHMP